MQCRLSRIPTNPATQNHAQRSISNTLSANIDANRSSTRGQILESVSLPIKHRQSLIMRFDFDEKHSNLGIDEFRRKTIKPRPDEFRREEQPAKKKIALRGDWFLLFARNVTCLLSIFASVYFSCECDANLKLCCWKTLSTVQWRPSGPLKLLIAGFIPFCLHCWRFPSFSASFA